MTGCQPVDVQAAWKTRCIELHFVDSDQFPLLHQHLNLSPEKIAHDQLHITGHVQAILDSSRRVKGIRVVRLQLESVGDTVPWTDISFRLPLKGPDINCPIV